MHNLPLSIHRDWRKPWNWSSKTWIVAILITGALAPVLVRWSLLRQVPDVALPFDVKDVIRKGISKQQDATLRYGNAIQILNSPEATLESVPNGFANFNDADTVMRDVLFNAAPWDARLDTWLLKQRQTLDEFRAATEMQSASGPDLRTADLSEFAMVHQRSFLLVVVVSAEAVRLERLGDHQAAWEWHRANLRCVRHCLQPRHAICYLLGTLIRKVAYSGIARWAESPNVTFDQLQAARNELLIDRQNAVSVLDLLKSNLLALQISLSQADLSEYASSWLDSVLPNSPILVYGKRVILWMNGEPEIVLRLARQTILNVADQIDIPLNQRRPSQKLKVEIVFEIDPSSPRQSGQLSADQLRQSLLRNRILMTAFNEHLVGSGTLDKTNRMDLARQNMLDAVLACQQYRRQHGDFPESLEQLVPQYLEFVPVDPMDSSGNSVQFQREDNGDLLIWSDGYEETDVEWSDELLKKDIGYRLRKGDSPSDESEQAGPQLENRQD